MSLVWYRISRFDPAVCYRPESTWTSFHDIGSSFEDGSLSLGAYVLEENKYLEAVKLLIECCRADMFAVSDLAAVSIADSSLSDIENGDCLPPGVALEVVRAELREELSCRLIADGRLIVDVGFDFRLYACAGVDCAEAIASIEALGLFVERDLPSPYESQ